MYIVSRASAIGIRALTIVAVSRVNNVLVNVRRICGKARSTALITVAQMRSKKNTVLYGP